MHEIELKALLTKEQYDNLISKFNSELEKINEESLHTIAFIPQDIRIRYSEKRRELIYKDKECTNIKRKEIIVNLENEEDISKLRDIFLSLNLEEVPPWVTHRNEYYYNFNNEVYTLCLQHTEKFAYILEVEIMAENHEIHEDNIKEIISSFGLTPVNNEEFKEKIQEYIRDN
jgi:hypothetical protein